MDPNPPRRPPEPPKPPAPLETLYRTAASPRISIADAHVRVIINNNSTPTTSYTFRESQLIQTSQFFRHQCRRPYIHPHTNMPGSARPIELEGISKHQFDMYAEWIGSSRAPSLRGQLSRLQMLDQEPWRRSRVTEQQARADYAELLSLYFMGHGLRDERFMDAVMRVLMLCLFPESEAWAAAESLSSSEGNTEREEGVGTPGSREVPGTPRSGGSSLGLGSLGGAPMAEPFRHVFVTLMVPTMVKAIVEKFVPGAPMRCLVADALALWSREDVLENVAQGVFGAEFLCDLVMNQRRVIRRLQMGLGLTWEEKGRYLYHD